MTDYFPDDTRLRSVRCEIYSRTKGEAVWKLPDGRRMGEAEALREMRERIEAAEVIRESRKKGKK